MKLLRRPAHDGPILFWDRCWILARHLFEHRNLAVAIDKLHGNPEVQQARERFTWHRAWNPIAPDHQVIHFGLTNLFEHSL